jgi:hypothetical protein
MSEDPRPLLAKECLSPTSPPPVASRDEGGEPAPQRVPGWSQPFPVGGALSLREPVRRGRRRVEDTVDRGFEEGGNRMTEQGRDSQHRNTQHRWPRSCRLP